MTLDLHQYSLKELKEIRLRIDPIIEEKVEEERKTALSEIEEIAKSRGFDLKDLLGKNAFKTSKTKKPPKYKDPESDKTWVGHGKQPDWFKEALSKGKARKDMLIK